MVARISMLNLERLSPHTHEPSDVGCPQGSFISPMTFKIYIKSLGRLSGVFRVCYHQYADETQLDILCSGCCSGLSVLSGLSFAVDQTKQMSPDNTEILFLVGGGPSGVGGHLPELDGFILPLSDQRLNLGTILDSAISLEQQISAMSRLVSQQFRLIAQLYAYSDKRYFKTSVHALLM